MISYPKLWLLPILPGAGLSLAGWETGLQLTAASRIFNLAEKDTVSLPHSHTARLADSLTVRLFDYQTVKLSDCQTVIMSDCYTVRLARDRTFRE